MCNYNKYTYYKQVIIYSYLGAVLSPVSETAICGVSEAGVFARKKEINSLIQQRAGLILNFRQFLCLTS